MLQPDRKGDARSNKQTTACLCKHMPNITLPRYYTEIVEIQLTVDTKACVLAAKSSTQHYEVRMRASIITEAGTASASDAYWTTLSFRRVVVGHRVVHGSILCDPIRPNPPQVEKFGPNPILTVIG